MLNTTTQSTDKSRRPALATIAALAVLGVLVAAPLLLVLVTAFTGHNDNPSELGAITRPENLQVVRNTLVLGLLVVIVATAFAAPLALLMSRTRLREHGWIDIVILIPFMTPPYISAMAWIEFTRPRGLADTYFGPVGDLLIMVFETPLGMAIVMGGEVYPFLYLLLRNALDRVGSSTDEAAAVHGASLWRRFRHVLVPMMAASYSLGALLVFIRAAGEFGTPVTLGNRIGYPVLVSQIHGDVTLDPLNFPRAAAFASILLGMGITAWGLQQWFLARQNALITTGRPSRVTVVPLGAFGTWAASVWMGIVFVLTVALPAFVLITGSTQKLRSGGLSFSNITLDHFREVLTPGRGGIEALSTSIVLALVAATVTTILGTAVALIAVSRRSAATRATDFLSVAPDVVPTIVLALGLIFLWNAGWMPVGLYNTFGMLVLAYAVIFLPLVVQNVKSVRLHIPDPLLEAAQVSGATKAYTYRRVLIPLLAPGIVAGWVLAFVIGIRELVASSLLRPPGTQLLSPWILSEFDEGLRSQAMAMTIIAVFSCTAVMIVLDRLRSRAVRQTV